MKIVITKNGRSGTRKDIKSLKIKDDNGITYPIHAALSTRAANAIKRNLTVFLDAKMPKNNP